jgi:hypothetical protein
MDSLDRIVREGHLDSELKNYVKLSYGILTTLYIQFLTIE